LRNGNTLGVLYISHSVVDDKRHKYSPRLVRTRKSRWVKYGVLSLRSLSRERVYGDCKCLLNGLGARVAERGQSCRVFCQTVSRQPPYIALLRWICPYYIKVAKQRKHSQNNNNRIKRMGGGCPADPIHQCFPTIFQFVTQNLTQTLGRYLPPLSTHEQQYFSQKCPFISVAHPIKRNK